MKIIDINEQERVTVSQSPFGGQVGKYQVLVDGEWKTQVERGFPNDPRVPTASTMKRLYAQKKGQCGADIKPVFTNSGEPDPDNSKNQSKYYRGVIW